jgi:hypothetical protein
MSPADWSAEMRAGLRRPGAAEGNRVKRIQLLVKTGCRKLNLMFCVIQHWEPINML